MPADTLTPIWKALADPTRRAILDMLKQGPHTTGQLSAAFDVSRYAVMKHLNVLVEAGLVAVRRQGRERWNHLNSVPLQQLYERWIKPYEAEWADALLGLKQYAEQSELVEGDRINMAEQTQTIELSSMLVAQDTIIQAEPMQVFDALVQPDAWWSHSFSEAPRAIHLEPVIGGRFWEEGEDEGEGALYATVTYVKRGESLQLRGPLGMRGAVSGKITFELEAHNGATLLKLTHRAVGEVSEEQKEGYTSGWQELLEGHFKDFVEQGVRLDRL